MRKNSKAKKSVQVLKKEENGDRVVKLPGGEVTVNARADLLTMGMQTGMQVMLAMFKEDVEALCGPRYQNQENRENGRWGTTGGEVTLGGHKRSVKRPRIRTKDGGEEVPLPSYEEFSNTDPLGERVLAQMLSRVSTRGYERSLETCLEEEKSRGTSKSAVSRRFVAMSTKLLAEWMSRSLKDLDIVVLYMDGIHLGDYTLIVAVGVDMDGKKHILGAWDGATENSIVCTMLLRDLEERGLNTDQGLLAVIDGSPALRKAIRDKFGKKVEVQRCQQHKIRNVKAQLPKGLKVSVEMSMRQAYGCDNFDTAYRKLKHLATGLENRCPGAAASLREGMEETLTVIKLGLTGVLRQSLQTTNIMESAFSIMRDVTGNVKRWRNGKMALRWASTGLVEAEKRMTRIRGYKELKFLREILKSHCQEPKAVDNEENVA